MCMHIFVDVFVYLYVHFNVCASVFVHVYDLYMKMNLYLNM